MPASGETAPSWATTPASVNGKSRGFTGRIHKADNAADPNLFPNNPQRAADQLADKIIDPSTTQPFANEAAGPNGDGSFVEAGVINYEQSGTDKFIPGDQPFPNLDPANQDFIALQAIAYLSLKRGTYRFGIACDDGFQAWAGPSAVGATNQVGIRSPGGSTAEVTFDVLAETDGVYAFRLLFFEGVGGADLEWYTVDLTTGEKVLVNADGGVLSYQSRNGDGSNGSATVVSTTPPAGLAGAAFTNVVVDEASKTITADLPATGDQGYLTISPARPIKGVSISGKKLVITY